MPIADVGCGPGHVAAWIAGHGRAAVGIDRAAGMVAAGRRTYPDTEFREGDFLDLPARDGEFGAVVAFYSIIHLEPGELALAFGEVCRVLRPGGRSRLFAGRVSGRGGSVEGTAFPPCSGRETIRPRRHLVEIVALNTSVGLVLGVGATLLLAGPHAGSPLGGALGAAGSRLQFVFTKKASNPERVPCSPS